MQLHGIHHLTAVSASIRENLRFYTGTMGMRLVKRSVNQDDVSAYHLFYADAVGSPGTDITFFDWNMPRERRGSRSVTRTSLRVNGSRALVSTTPVSSSATDASRSISRILKDSASLSSTMEVPAIHRCHGRRAPFPNSIRFEDSDQL
jgi:catechol 2,3-dioxygenase-like lactoylglutathione lyase family enzyme